MQVLRKIKKSNYTVIDNAIFKDRNLSLKAKGLLCLMLSLPDGWNFSIKGLATLSTDGVSAVRAALNELKKEGYFTRNYVRENGKISKIEYIISETRECDFLDLENLKQENLKQENQTQLNTNRLSNKESNTKSINSSSYTDIWKSLSTEQIDYLMVNYEEGSNLIQAVYEDVKRKQKTIDKPFEYIIGYAENKKWSRSAT